MGATIATGSFIWHASQQEARINYARRFTVAFPITAFLQQFSRSRTARVSVVNTFFPVGVTRRGDASARIRQRRNHLKASASVSPWRKGARKRSEGGEGERRRGEGRGRERERETERRICKCGARSAFKPICMTRRQACTFELRSRARDFDKC